jgi:hypothetical protein
MSKALKKLKNQRSEEVRFSTGVRLLDIYLVDEGGIPLGQFTTFHGEPPVNGNSLCEEKFLEHINKLFDEYESDDSVCHGCTCGFDELEEDMLGNPVATEGEIDNFYINHGHSSGCALMRD